MKHVLTIIGLLLSAVPAYATNPVAPAANSQTQVQGQSQSAKASSHSQSKSRSSASSSIANSNAIKGGGARINVEGSPSAPALMGAASGPCLGPTTSGSAGGAAFFSFGFGRSEIDEGCARERAARAISIYNPELAEMVVLRDPMVIRELEHVCSGKTPYAAQYFPCWMLPGATPVVQQSASSDRSKFGP